MTQETKQSNTTILAAIFDGKEKAEQAYDDLKDAGYGADEVNVVMASDTRDKYYADKKDDDSGNKAMEGAGTGGAIGSVAGGIAGAIAAIGTNLLIPGLGIVVLGPLAGALAGAGAGGVTGGLLGTLVGAGIPEEKAKVYNEGLKNGKILLSVTPHNGEDVKKLTEKWDGQAEEIYFRTEA